MSWTSHQRACIRACIRISTAVDWVRWAGGELDAAPPTLGQSPEAVAEALWLRWCQL